MVQRIKSKDIIDVWRRMTVFVILLVFLLSEVALPVRAQEVSRLPLPGAMVALSPAFTPALLQGVRVYPDNPFRLDFILDQGDSRLSPTSLQSESTRLIRYFLAALTVPEKDLWVNLSPYEKDRVIPEMFGQTEMGRDLLAQDYLLKQITASVMYPDGAVGREFWGKVYAQAKALYGAGDIPIDVFNKVWIVPEKALVYENERSAYVVASHLKVLLDSDYKAMSQAAPGEVINSEAEAQDLSKRLIREVVIPILEKEVNEGKNFARVRQVYNALILAIWLKDKVSATLLGRAYVDQDKVLGIDLAEKKSGEQIWARYVQAFKQGVYNYIRDDVDQDTQEVVARKYFSGGIIGANVSSIIKRTRDKTALALLSSDRAMVITSNFEPVGQVEDHAQKVTAGVLYKPREAVVQNDPNIYKGIRSSAQIRESLLLMARAGKRLEVRLPVRAFDGPGSGNDKQDRRMVITPQGPIQFEEIPISPTFTHKELYLTLSVEAAEDPDTTVYVAEEYGYPASQPFVVKGHLPTKDGRVMVPDGMLDSPAYIFQYLFGISGIKITANVSHPVIIAGGVESSTVFLGGMMMLASMLKGADWTFADVHYRELRLENDVFNGTTGGQGGFAYVQGGVAENIWLSSLTDIKGQPIFGDEVFSREVVPEQDYSFFESRMAFIQLGKSFNGGGVDPRTAEVTNIMGRDLMADKDPEAIRLYQEGVKLSHAFVAGLRNKDMPEVIRTVNRFMEIRDERNYRWFDLALMAKGTPGRPAYADRYADFLKNDPVLQSFYAKYGPDLRNISLYSYYSGDMIANAKKHRVGFFMVGNGGSKTNAVAIAETADDLQSFLRDNGLELFDIKEASNIVKGAGVLKGYIPFRIGGRVQFNDAFRIYGFEPPAFPPPALLREDNRRIAVEPIDAAAAVDFQAMRQALPTEEEIEETADKVVRGEIAAVVANIRKNLQSIEQKVKDGVIDLNAPLRVRADDPILEVKALSRSVRWGIVTGTFDPVHWGDINNWLEFINRNNALVLVSPGTKRNGLALNAILPFYPLLRYTTAGYDRVNKGNISQMLYYRSLNRKSKLLFLGKNYNPGSARSLISSEGIRANESQRIFLPRTVSAAIADGSLYVDHTGVKAAWMKSARDIRGVVVNALRGAFPERYNIESGGFGSIDISSGKFNKGDVIGQIFAKNKMLKTVLYFGNEFFADGNDASTVFIKQTLAQQGKKLVIFSVDEDPAKRSKRSREDTIWLGSGPEASARVMRMIADAIAAGEREITIYDAEDGVDKSVTIALPELLGQGMLLFDVDGTLIQKKEDDLLPGSVVGQEFVRLLNKLPMGILSAHSRIMQTGRISDPLKGIVDLSRLFLYVNGGRTLVNFDGKGEEAMEFLVPKIPPEDIQEMRRIIGELALANFGMNDREFEAFKEWINDNGSFGVIKGYDDRRFKDTRLKLWWRVAHFIPDEVKDYMLKEMQASGQIHYMTEPFLVNKDEVQITVALLPKRLAIKPRSADSAQTGGIDLTSTKQRLELSSQGDGLRFKIDRDLIERMQQAGGLEPVIVAIHPLHTLLSEFLGQ